MLHRCCDRCGEGYWASRRKVPGFCSTRCRTAAHRARHASPGEHVLKWDGRYRCVKCGRTWERPPRGGCSVPDDPRRCRSCGHTDIVRDADRREVAGGAHQGTTGLCWFCWVKTPAGEGYRRWSVHRGKNG